MPKPPLYVGHPQHQSEFVASILAFADFAPQPDQLSEIVDYLAAITAAVDVLPACDPNADELPTGFDPAWPEKHP